jgi:hypothetical protein
MAEFERLSETADPVKKAELKTACIRAGMSETAYHRAQRELLSAGRLTECGERKKGHLDSLTASQNDSHNSSTVRMTATGHQMMSVIRLIEPVAKGYL